MLKQAKPNARAFLPEGTRVQVKITDPARYAVGAAEALNGLRGTIERNEPCSFNGEPSPGPASLVRFDAPAPRWHTHGSETLAFWFPPHEVEPLPTISRKRAESLLWRHTHTDFKGTRADGTRCVLHSESGVTQGTESWPLGCFSDAQLLAKLPRAVRAEIGAIAGKLPETTT